jgi:hypothetical protein
VLQLPWEIAILTIFRFYLGNILVMIGYTDSWTKTRIILGNTAWSFINGTAIALISPRFKRRTMFLTGAIGMLVVYISWTIAMARTEMAIKAGTTNKAAAITVLFFIFFYSPWYNISNNALAYSKPSWTFLDLLRAYDIVAYMVEIFPCAERSRGISVEQFFVRGAGYFTTYINPIGMANAGWKYLIMYNVMICFEIATIYFFYSETQGRTLEELAFLFEDERLLGDKATIAVEKTNHHESADDQIVGEKGATDIEQIEDQQPNPKEL